MTSFWKDSTLEMLSDPIVKSLHAEGTKTGAVPITIVLSFSPIPTQANNGCMECTTNT